MSEATEPLRFTSNSESMFFKCRETSELHFPANLSLAGDSLLEEEREAAPPPKPNPPEDDES